MSIDLKKSKEIENWMLRNIDLFNKNQELEAKLKEAEEQNKELLKKYDHFSEQKHTWYLGTPDETKDEFLNQKP